MVLKNTTAKKLNALSSAYSGPEANQTRGAALARGVVEQGVTTD